MDSNLVGIHHPDGSYKRISFGKRVADAFALIEGESSAPADQFYKVRWTAGRTQGGSSGSPLFSDPGIVVGVDSYGPKPLEGTTVCDIEPLDAGYGRFSVMYPYLRAHLEDASVAVSPTALRFTVSNGIVAPPTQQFINVSTTATASVGFTAVAEVPWIRLSSTASSTSATMPAPVGVSLDPRFLSSAGTYTGRITITHTGGSPQSVTVQAIVTVAPSSVRATATPNPVLEEAPDAEGYSWFYSVNLEEKAGVATKLTTLRFGGTDLTENIVPWFGTDLLPGFGRVSVDLRSHDVTVPSNQVFEFRGVDVGSGQTWTTSLAVTFLAGTQRPVISNGGIVNAASFRPQLAAGSIFTIFGENLSESESQASTIPLPTSMAGTTVTIDGVSCPLFFVSPRQINAQVPTTIVAGSALLIVRVPGQEHSAAIVIGGSAPGLFTTDGVRAVVINQDGSLNSRENPAKKGSVVVAYATGQGAVSPFVPPGAAAGASPLSRPTLPVEATIGGSSARVLFAGLTPGLVGLLQLNLEVPLTVPQGDLSLVIAVGGQTSNSALISVGE
jgi:uncharacterized protein (TIGR03437 family)